MHLIVPFAPAGTTDIAARLMGQWLSEPLLLVTTSSAINATLFESKLNYNFLRDIVPIAGIFRVPNVMVVHPTVPAKTFPEFIAYAKANPGKINVESPGAGCFDCRWCDCPPEDGSPTTIYNRLVREGPKCPRCAAAALRAIDPEHPQVNAP